MQRAAEEPFVDLLRLALEAARTGPWRWSARSGRVEWPTWVAPMLELPEGALPATLEACLSRVHPDDRRGALSALWALSAGAERSVELRALWPDGSVRWLEVRGRLERDEQGRAVEAAGTVVDVTGRKREDRARRGEEGLFRRALDDQPEMIARWRPDGTRTFANQAYCRAFGAPYEAIVGSSFLPDLPDHIRRQVLEKIASLTPASPVATDVHVRRLADGSTHHQEWTDRGLFDEQGRLVEIQSIGRDVTERETAAARAERANRALRTMSHCNQALVRASTEDELLRAICQGIVDHGYRLAWVGYAEHDEARSVRVACQAGDETSYLKQILVRWDDSPQGSGPFGTAIRTARPVVCHSVVSEPSMEPWREQTSARGYAAGAALPLKDASGVAFGALAVYASERDGFDDEEARLLAELADNLAHGIQALRARDERLLAERSLAASEERFRSAMQHSPIGMGIVSPEGAYLEVNPALCKIIGWSRDELLGMTCDELTHPDDRPANAALMGQILRGEIETYHIKKRYQHKDGRYRWILLHVSLIWNPDGTPRHFVGQVEDITERLAAEAALRESEARLRQIAENLREVVWLMDAASREILYVSPAYEATWGRSCESLYQAPGSWLEGVHADDRDRIRAASLAVLGARGYDEEYRVVRPDGAVRWVHERAFPIRDARGVVYRVVGVIEDVTERRRIEEQFLQSQKMDAVGQLAGGIAHDFNNLIGAIMLQVEAARRIDGAPSGVGAYLADIAATVERASSLTRQLLRISRKAVLQPRRLDLNENVASLARVLERVLCEGVQVSLSLHPRPLFTRADAAMIDQVLMNLAVNARDAMPGGGQLSIETGEAVVTAEESRSAPDVAPGRYVLLRVADSGVGIAPELLPRIFEPFFTTKEPGQGTGLGLATVFGIVRQHRGLVRVSSKRGEGSSFEILLPSCDEPAHGPDEPSRSGHCAPRPQLEAVR